jgi:hypothetical protein
MGKDVHHPIALRDTLPHPQETQTVRIIRFWFYLTKVEAAAVVLYRAFENPFASGKRNLQVICPGMLNDVA